LLRSVNLLGVDWLPIINDSICLFLLVIHIIVIGRIIVIENTFASFPANFSPYAPPLILEEVVRVAIFLLEDIFDNSALSKISASTSPLLS
jgi:hypothetical protein